MNEFRTALRLLPDFPVAHFGLAGALLNLGQTDEAIAEFSEALRLDPSLKLAMPPTAGAYRLRVLIEEGNGGKLTEATQPVQVQ